MVRYINIYKNLEKLSISLEDILAYADDILVLCTTKRELTEAIDLINKWSKKFGLQPNNAKSGVIEFLPRKGKQIPSLKVGDTINSIPIVPEYKYLGCWLSQKLTMDTQLEKIKKTSDILKHKLLPALLSCSTSYRLNLWKLLISPLIQFLGPLYTHEEAVGRKLDAEKLIKASAKGFIGLSKTTRDEIIYALIGWKPAEKFHSLSEQSWTKWQLRKSGLSMVIPKSNTPAKKIPNWIPKEFATFNNTLTALCPKCNKAVMNESHLLRHHNIEVPSPLELIEKLQKIRGTRGQRYSEAKILITNFLNQLKCMNL